MPRNLKLSVGGLNVRIHPHSPELYDQFLQAIYALREPVHIRGDRHGMITALDRRNLETGIIRGVITTFTKIDMNGRWFDQTRLDDVSPDLLKEINIPANVHPNSAAFRFAMNVNNHVLTFEHYNAGKYLVPKSAYTLFRKLSDNLDITTKFGAVKISILQDKSSLDRIFGMTRLKRITFIVDRPNPDIWSDDIEGQVDAHLAAVHAQQISVTYTAPSGGSLVETPSLRKLGNTALRNGAIEATGTEGKAHQRISTIDSPRLDQTTYNEEVESEVHAFERLRNSMEAGE
jgi:hypothetical protein